MIDAHCHLQKSELGGALPSDVDYPSGLKWRYSLINGTHPGDWASVARLVTQDNRLLAAYGVHPWCVDSLPKDWPDQLETRLKQGGVCVGEIGIDSWVEPRNEALQDIVLKKQLEIAQALSLPPTLHVLRAWDRFHKVLENGAGLQNGFLVHGFSGSLEMLKQIVAKGGYISVSAYAADPKRKRMREAIRNCPLDQLLIETDAPDMSPPADQRIRPLIGPNGEQLNHPANLINGYRLVAELRQISLQETITAVEANFFRLFGR